MSVSNVRMRSVFNRSKIMFSPWFKEPDISMSDYPTGISVYTSDYTRNIHKQRRRETESLDLDPIVSDGSMPELASQVVQKYPKQKSTAWIQQFDDTPAAIRNANRKRVTFPPLMPPIQPKDPVWEKIIPQRQYRYNDALNLVPEAPPLPVPPVDSLRDYQLVQYGRPVKSIELPLKNYTGRIPNTTELKYVKPAVKNSVWTPTSHHFHKDFDGDYGIVKYPTIKHNPMSRTVMLTDPKNPFNKVTPRPPSIV